MATSWQGRDRGLQNRMLMTMFGLGLVYLVFISVVIAMGASAVVVLLLAGGFLLVQIFFSDKIALRSMNARITEPHEAPELHAMIERMAQMQDIPKPKVAIADTHMPNAFAAGHSRKSAVVCCTTGLMERLDRDELEGVVAHEMAHVINRDVMVMTIAGFLATLAGLMIRIGMYGRMGGDRNGAAVFAMVLVVSVVTYALSFILIRTLSRYREYAADRGAAIITGAPAQLASALQKITGAMSRIPQQDLRTAEGMNAFFIMPATSKSALSGLFSTHPPAEERIRRLMEMQANMDAMGQLEI
jgi:heat shock protein HtpX